MIVYPLTVRFLKPHSVSVETIKELFSLIYKHKNVIQVTFLTDSMKIVFDEHDEVDAFYRYIVLNHPNVMICTYGPERWENSNE